MAKKSTKPSDKLIKADRIALKIIGVIKALAAAIYLVGFLALISNGEMHSVVNSISGNLHTTYDTANIVVHVGFVILIAFYIFLAVLCFRATKPNAKPTALMVISLVIFIFTAITQGSSGSIFAGNLNWALLIQDVINLTAFGCAFQIRKYNK